MIDTTIKMEPALAGNTWCALGRSATSVASRRPMPCAIPDTLGSWCEPVAVWN